VFEWKFNGAEFRQDWIINTSPFVHEQFSNELPMLKIKAETMSPGA